MNNPLEAHSMSRSPVCSSPGHFHRRTLLRTASGALFLNPIAALLERQAFAEDKSRPKSVILLWLEGGPSQLETFDPHPGTRFGGEVQAISTSAPDIQISNLLPQLAPCMHDVALIRSVVSKEGDHERAVYTIKNGYRPDPTLVHPSIGAVLCHQSPLGADIPRHISILPGGWPSRGGYLGAKYDAFKVFDPATKVPDVSPWVAKSRFERRLEDLRNIAETEFARGRLGGLDNSRTHHPTATAAAQQMMSSEQLDAFDVSKESQSVRDAFGHTPFGRGCLAAARLIEVGVRCVEVTLTGWDSHITNHEFHVAGCSQLDPALASLIQRLKERDLLDTTLVVCGGEFGRTPQINPAEGRDHWPHGFSVLMAGCGIAGGRVHGQTNPDPQLDSPEKNVVDPVEIGDLHATILQTLDLPYDLEWTTPIGRPMKFAEGKPIRSILS